MLNIILCLLLCIKVSYAEINESSLLCGSAPENILTCLTNPHPRTISKSVLSKCQYETIEECDYANCIFREQQWFDNEGNIDRVKLVAYYNQISKDQPWWKSVIDQVISTCMERVIPPQSVYLDCPTFDILHCLFNVFIQKTPASKWSTTPECTQARQFAASGCPLCPSECLLARVVPANACNACTYNTDTMKIDTDTMKTDTDKMKTDTDTMKTDTDTMKTDTDTMKTDTVTIKTDDDLTRVPSKYML